MLRTHALCPALVVAALACHPRVPPPVGAAPEATQTATDTLKQAQARYLAGDMDGASAAYISAMADPAAADLALAGALLVDEAAARDAAILEVLGGPPGRRLDPLVTVRGASALYRIRPWPEQALDWLSAACRQQHPALAGAAELSCALAAITDQGGPPARCESGCDAPTTVPLGSALGLPVVRLQAANGQVLRMVVDTGASISAMSPAAAQRLGLRPVTDLAVTAAGVAGDAEAWPTAFDFAIGDRQLRNVPVVVSEVPHEALDGLLSPQDAFRGEVVALDMARYAMTVGGPSPSPADGGVYPWIETGGLPALRVWDGHRPPRLAALDTGAVRTLMARRWDALGPAVPKAEPVDLWGIGDHTRTVDGVAGVLELQTGPMALPLSDAAVGELWGSASAGLAAVHGLLGQDTWGARVLVLDRAGGSIGLSDPPAPLRWRVGDTAEFAVSGSRVAEARYSETVLTTDRGAVTLAVETQQADRSERFALVVPDTPGEHLRWMGARQHLAAMDGNSGPGGPTVLEDEALFARWSPMMVPFQDPSHRETWTLDSQDRVTADGLRVCEETRIRVRAEDQAAVFRMVTCPGDPWAVHLADLSSARTGEVLWRLERVVGEG